MRWQAATSRSSSYSFFFSSRRRHTRLTCDWSSDVCSSDLGEASQLAEKVNGAICRSVDSNCSRPLASSFSTIRSEERRVGKECRSGWSTYDEEKKEQCNASSYMAAGIDGAPCVIDRTCLLL